MRSKYTEILHHSPSLLKKTIMSESSLPMFQFEMSIMEVYCMVDSEGNVVDGDE